MKDIPFHPFAEEYPMMPAKDIGRLEQGMIENGYDATFPIVLYKKLILDGRNRFIAAKAASVKPTFITFKGTEEEARQFVRTANEERRHLAQEWLERRRQQRRERVAAAHAEGKSTRTIAEEEGVTQKTVLNDLETLGTKSGEDRSSPESVSDSDTAPEPKKVTGADGKQYPSKAPPVLCERCKRTGAVKDCARCKEAQQAAKDAKRRSSTTARDAYNRQGGVNGTVNGKHGKNETIPENAGDAWEGPADESRNGKHEKNGKVDFDDRTISDMLGKLARALGERSKSHGGETKEYKDCRGKWELLNSAWSRWQLVKEKTNR